MALVFNPLAQETSFSFLNARIATLALSAFLVVASLVLLVSPGLNLGIDFLGGTQVTLPTQGMNLIDMQAAIQGARKEVWRCHVQANKDDKENKEPCSPGYLNHG